VEEVAVEETDMEAVEGVVMVEEAVVDMEAVPLPICSAAAVHPESVLRM